MKLCRILLSALLLATVLVAAPRPAAACACGAMVTTTANVSGETALVTWDGTTETIDMMLTLDGSAADGAWIMPTPKGTKLSLGNPATFPRLVDATRPRVEKQYSFWPSWPFARNGYASAPGRDGGAPPVQVDAVTSVGPFTVTTLSGSDPAAVNGWLAQHGYPAKPVIVPTLQEYLGEGWVIQAVKLTPMGGKRFAGDLDPLRMTFDTAEPVYPIKLSQHSPLPSQQITLYVASAHRVDLRPGLDSLEVIFAGRVDRSVIGRAGIGDDQTVYLTAFSGSVASGELTSDFTFAQAATDTPYQRVRYKVVDMGWVTDIVLLAGLAAVLLGIGIRVGRRSRTAER